VIFYTKYKLDGWHLSSRIATRGPPVHCLVDNRFTAFSLLGQFAPRSESANKTQANLPSGTFTPRPFRYLAHSLPGPLAPWNLRSQERNGPGTFVPLVHDVDTRYSNYTLLLMRTFSIDRCGTDGLSQTLICYAVAKSRPRC